MWRSKLPSAGQFACPQNIQNPTKWKGICFTSHPGRAWGSSMAEGHLLSLFPWQVSFLAPIFPNIWWFAGFPWCSYAFEDIFNGGVRTVWGVWGCDCFSQQSPCQERWHCSAWETRHCEWPLGPSGLAVGSGCWILGTDWPCWVGTILGKVVLCAAAVWELASSSWFGYELPSQHSPGCRGISLSLPSSLLPSAFWPPSKVLVPVRWFVTRGSLRAGFVLISRHLWASSCPFSKFGRAPQLAA